MEMNTIKYLANVKLREQTRPKESKLPSLGTVGSSHFSFVALGSVMKGKHLYQLQHEPQKKNPFSTLFNCILQIS